ncbi:MAG: FAD-dependent oxidoreductase [Acidimicrobiales bacterium]|nr:FAD-dependent oxidoreductase [Acidimicrobiales bacterium]
MPQPPPHHHRAPPGASRSADVVVVGAGPAGLVAALGAARAGHEVVVVEAQERVGGMAASFEVAGQRVDLGSHRLHPAIAGEHLTLLRDLLGDDLQVRPRHGRIRLAGRWLAFPLRAGDLVRRLPPSFALGATRDALLGPFRRPRADTFAEVVRVGLGPTVASTFYEPYAAKLWGVPPDQLAGELARRRVSASSTSDVLARLVPRRARRGAAAGAPGAAEPEKRTFLYPATGFGTVSEALADAAVAAGATIELGVAVDGVDLGRSVSGAATGVHLADGTTVEAGRVWSTAPLPALARWAQPQPPAEVLAAAGGIEHRGMVLVYLVVDRPRWTEFDAHYFPAADNPIARLSEPKNYRDGPDPVDRTVLCAEVPADVGDATWTASDADLGALVRDALLGLGLPDPDPVAVEVRRLPRVYPRYRVGFEADLAVLEEWAAGHPRLLTFGRQGLFVPDNTHHALVMGSAAAAALRADGTFDEAAWRTARDGFRAHVVED